MAELALVASIVGVADFAAAISKNLFNLSQKIGVAGREAEAVAQEVISLSAILGSLRTTFQAQDSNDEYLRSQVPEIIQNCERDLAELDRMAKSVINSDKAGNGKVSLRTRLGWVRNTTKIKSLRASIETSKASLILMCSAVHFERSVKPEASLEARYVESLGPVAKAKALLDNADQSNEQIHAVQVDSSKLPIINDQPSNGSSGRSSIPIVPNHPEESRFEASLSSTSPSIPRRVTIGELLFSPTSTHLQALSDFRVGKAVADERILDPAQDSLPVNEPEMAEVEPCDYHTATLPDRQHQSNNHEASPAEVVGAHIGKHFEGVPPLESAIENSSKHHSKERSVAHTEARPDETSTGRRANNRVEMPSEDHADIEHQRDYHQQDLSPTNGANENSEKAENGLEDDLSSSDTMIVNSDVSSDDVGTCPSLIYSTRLSSEVSRLTLETAGTEQARIGRFETSSSGKGGLKKLIARLKWFHLKPHSQPIQVEKATMLKVTFAAGS